jgi:beta-1,4-N-acetylglucosaminyltransferase
MIFATVGTHERSFNRLIQSVDEMAGMLAEPVLIQIGNSTIIPKHAGYFRFASYHEMENRIDQARIIISHAGAGSIISTLIKKRPLIVAPRYRKFGEAMDDHQLELAEALDHFGLAITIYEMNPSTLLSALDRIDGLAPAARTTVNLKTSLRAQLQTWDSISAMKRKKDI